MRIVFLADAPYVHTRRWVEHFVAQGHHCEVISFRPAEIAGAQVHYVGGAEPLGKARYLIHARRVKALVHELRPDLLHALHLTSYGFLAALSGFHPNVISVWGTDILEAPNLTPFHRWLTRYALSHADVLTATGLHLATETTRWAPRGTPVTNVPYGVDLQRFRPAAREAGETVVLGTVARLSVEKGLPYLLDAFAALRAKYGERVRLRIAGEGPERAKLVAQAQRLGIADAVEFAGWLEHDTVPGFLQSLDVFVLPSTYEGFGVAAVEASAMALPIVASNVYGIPDVVRHDVTGLLVPSKDGGALAEALSALVDDAGLRRRLGDEGQRYVTAHYDWQDNVAQMEHVYERALSLAPVAAR